MKTLLVILVSIMCGVGLATAQVTSAISGNWSNTATWGGVVPGASDNVVIASGTTVELDAATISCNNLDISGTLQFNAATSVAMTVNGNITLLTGGVFRMLANTVALSGATAGLVHTLELKGNITHGGTTFDLRTGTAGTTLSVCNLTLSGTANSTLTVPYVSSSNGEFNYLTINKTSGGKVILGSNIVLAGGSGTGLAAANSGINFISGVVETSIYMLAYQGSTAAQVTGGSSASYVIGNLARGMSTTAGSSKDFFVGDANGYRPIGVRSTTSGASTGHLVIVSCVAGNANTGSSVFGGGIDLVSQVRYYKIGYSNAIAGAANMNFDLFKPTYGADDGVVVGNTDLRVAYSTNVQARGTWTGIAQTTTHTTDLTSPPTQITPDAITAVTVITGEFLYVTLARASGTTANPLPVELQSFIARSVRRSVELVWSTATETNNAGFTIERKSVDNWVSVGFVQGAGTSNAPRCYSFVDNTPETGRLQYRLKQTDRDWAIQYSKTVEVTLAAAPAVLSLNGNYPNPFNPTTNIRFVVPSAGRAVVKVFNILGKEVATVFDAVAVPGQQYTVPFNAASLPSGNYFSQLDFAGKRLTQKMLLLK